MFTKRLTLYLIFLVLATFSCAEAYAQQRWSIGPRLGVNYSTILGDTRDPKFVPGFTGGFYVMYSDINHFGISGDILYSQKGAKYDFTQGNTRFAYTQRLNYIEVPIVARYFLNLRGKVRPNIFAGGAVNFLLNARQRNRKVNNQSAPSVDNNSAFKTVDVGLIAGVGLNFKISPARWIQTDLRYQYGLTPILVAAPAGVTTPTLRNSSLSLLVSYAIGAGKKYSK